MFIIDRTMGLCFSREDRSAPPKRRASRRITNHSAAADGGVGSNRWTRMRSSRKEENLIHERALAAAILFQQQLQNGGGTAPFDRSTSLRYPTGNSKRNQALPRSSSSRARSLTDPLLQPHQLVNQVYFQSIQLLCCFRCSYCVLSFDCRIVYCLPIMNISRNFGLLWLSCVLVVVN